jgi:mannose-6-phosphate isomerase-like protein (cupin superfamily)
MTDAANTPTKYSRTDSSGRDAPKCRVILPPPQGGWSEPALFEWELTGESWADEHPHSEYNFVIEGQLFVESGGVTVEARTGDVVRVPAGAVVKYWASKYARLLAIHSRLPWPSWQRSVCGPAIAFSCKAASGQR